MKIGFSTIACPDFDVSQVIQIAKKNNYDSIEIRFLKGTVDLASLPEFSEAMIHQTKKKFIDAGIEVVAVDTSVRMNAKDPEVRKKNVLLARQNIAIAKGLGATMIRVFGGPLLPEQSEEESLNLIAKGLGEIASMSIQDGILTLLETHDDFSTSPRCLELYSRGDCKDLYILWDTLHSFRHGESPEYTWAQLGDRIKHIHIKDSFIANSTKFDFAPTGEGVMPMKKIINLLKSKKYLGKLHFEWEKGWHPEIDGPEISLPHFSKYISNLT